jgi:tetratricopeptide (TPR) repeat protein
MTPRAAGPSPGRAEVLLEAATHKEILDGDLKAAVSLYERVVAQAGDNHLVAAKALVGIGRCHEHLGDRAGARKAYERVVREFASQKAEAAEARRRLKALGGSAGAKRGISGRKPDPGKVASKR